MANDVCATDEEQGACESWPEGTQMRVGRKAIGHYVVDEENVDVRPCVVSIL